jgi:hypothetical protein
VTLLDTLSERYDSPREFYRATYKYTDCGPSVGLLVQGRGWLWCDRLRDLGTFDDMRARGESVEALAVSSIVEGTDAEVPAIEATWEEIQADPWGRIDSIVAEIDRAAQAIWDDTHGCDIDSIVAEIDRAAQAIWDDTHGCDACAAHWREEWGHGDVEAGCPVWSECPECDGEGIAI